MALTVCGLPRRLARARKSGWIGPAAPLTAPSPGINGPGETPPEQRDPATIAAGISACERCSPLLDDELAKMPWLPPASSSALAMCRRSFVYNLLSILDGWQPAPSAALVMAAD